MAFTPQSLLDRDSNKISGRLKEMSLYKLLQVQVQNKPVPFFLTDALKYAPLLGVRLISYLRLD